MNSVNRPRARPRVDSLNFRVFFRLLLFEAAARVHLPRTHASRQGWEAARYWRRGSVVVRKQAESVIKAFDDRRWYA